MSVLINGNHRVAGTITFDSSISVERLSAVAVGLKQHNPERWVDLHIRGAGDDGTHHLAFHYILEDSRKKTHKQAVSRLLQYLRDQFGARPKLEGQKEAVPHGVKRWSISTLVVLI